MKTERTRDAQSQRIDRQKANRAIRVQRLPGRGREGDVIVMVDDDGIDDYYIRDAGQWQNLSRNAEVESLKKRIIELEKEE